MIKETTNQVEKRFQPPASLLVVGSLDEAETFSRELLMNLAISKFDTKIVRPEDSEGKSNIISIKQILEAQRFIGLTPNGTYKAMVIANAGTLRSEAANALLKTLEEPPKYAIIILLSDTDDLLPTVISRCQKVNLSRGLSSSLLDIPAILSSPFYQQSRDIEKIVAEQRPHLFLNGFELYARGKLRQEKSLRYVNLIKEIVNAKREIKNNVNTKLILESLVLRYKYNV